MCTVTFIAQRNGYCLGMNRDEQLTRADGLPPTRHNASGRAVLSPSEPSGGTWVALNDTGVSLALINWYSVTKRVPHSAVSRGGVVRAVGAADSAEFVNAVLRGLPLERINPFRLVGIFPSSGEIFEWRWNLERLVKKRTDWRTQQWISSGFDEPAAQRARGKEFRQALEQTAAPGVSWLRKLHSSHAPHVGPFSTCMHRADAETVSYTEISVSSRTATMRYCAGTPCRTPYLAMAASIRCIRQQWFRADNVRSTCLKVPMKFLHPLEEDREVN
jgi:Transport and Golgi organisation 2